MSESSLQADVSESEANLESFHHEQEKQGFRRELSSAWCWPPTAESGFQRFLSCGKIFFCFTGAFRPTFAEHFSGTFNKKLGWSDLV